MTEQHHRRSIRLKDYDYTQNGAYFVTVCAHEKRCMFGHVVDGAMTVNAWGQVVQACWDEIPMHFPMVELDAFVVMPNHVHGIIVITDDGRDMTCAEINHMQNNISRVTNVGATHGSPLRPNGPQRNSLGAIIGQFKSSVTRRINRLPNPPDHPIWQRSYYDHIIRTEESLNTIRAYVANNAAKWVEDKLFAES